LDLPPLKKFVPQNIPHVQRSPHGTYADLDKHSPQRTISVY